MIRGHLILRAASAAFRCSLPVSCIVLSGCAKSCKEDRPYVPYGIDAASPAVPAMTQPSADPSAAQPAASFTAVPAERAQAATVLTLDGATLAAPQGKVLHAYSRADWNADGKDDVVAWTQDTQGAQGALVWYPRQEKGFGPAVTLLVPPATWAPGDGCRTEAELWRIGLRTAWLKLSVACANAGPPQSRPQWATVIAPAKQPAVRVEVSIKPGLVGEDLTLNADATDRDGDGVDDVALTVSLAGEPSPLEAVGQPVAAELRWFDRPAGLSRDPHEPEASLRAQAARISKVARKKGALDEVASSARRLRRLHTLLCDEGKRVELKGEELSCSSSQALQEADLAELDAALKIPEAARAIAVLSRMERPGAAFDPKRLADARSRYEKAFGTVRVAVREAPGVPMLGPATTPSWGALTFIADSTLFVRENAGTMSVEAESLAGKPSQTGPSGGPWLVPLAAPAGKWMLEAVVDGCDGAPLRARMHSSEGTTVEVPLPIASEPRSFCGSGRSPVPVIPLGWTERGLEALIAGSSVRITAEPPKASLTPTSAMGPVASGAARSHDGRWIVVPVGFGLAFAGPNGKGALWTHERLQGASPKLRDCTVADNMTVAACIEGNRVLWMKPERTGDGG